MKKNKSEFACGLGSGAAFVTRPNKIQSLCFEK